MSIKPLAVWPLLWLFLMFFSIWTVSGEGDSDSTASEEVLNKVHHEGDAVVSLVHFAQSVSRFMEFAAQFFGLEENADPLEQNFLSGPAPFLQKSNNRNRNNNQKTRRNKHNSNVATAYVGNSPNYVLRRPPMGFGPDSDPLDSKNDREKVSQKDSLAASRLREVMTYVARESFSPSSRWPCSGGFRAIPSTEMMRCGKDNKTLVTAMAFSKMGMAERQSCTYESGKSAVEVCVCSVSHVWTIRSGLNARGSDCVSRQLLVSPRLNRQFACDEDPTAVRLGVKRHSESDFCLRVSRRAKLEIEVNTSFRWFSNEEMRDYMTVNDKQVLLGSPQRNTTYVTLSPVAVGTYDDLERSSLLYYFIIQPNPADKNSFAMSREFTLRHNGVFEEIIYPFAAPHLIRQQYTRVPLTTSNLRTYFGNGNNYFMHTVRRDLGLVGNEFLSGNTMYMEVGFSGSGVPFEHRHARIWISFNDLPDPGNRFHYAKPLNPLALAGIAFAVVLVFFALAALVWICCSKRSKMISESLLRESDAKLIKKGQ